MKSVLPVAAVLLLALTASAQVRIWEEPLAIPTYAAGAPSLDPMFYAGRTYQGARGEIFPYPMQDMLAGSKTNKTYRAVYLENEYVKICVLPELGGRIFSAVDKTNGYDFFYRQEVIKPALIGMLGAWISGGVEWNFPHHHRASTFLPVKYKIEEHADGSKTVWVGEVELRQRLKWTIGLSLRPGSSILEAKVRFINRTPVLNSFLYFANVAVHTNEHYQVIFPPSTEWATHHSKRQFSKWPIADGVYGGVDFSKGVDVSWWKNHPSSTSMFAWNYEEDFLAGYDHGKQAGVLHVADHHLMPGKKFFTWGTGPAGRMWDKILSDKDDPYLELMVGAYSDNQPDYSWMQPHEVKSFSHYWYPFRGTGGVKNANLHAAVNVERGKDNTLKVAFYATAAHANARVVVTVGGKAVLEKDVAIDPAHPFAADIALPEGTSEFDARAALIDGGKELVAYQPRKPAGTAQPKPVEAPPAPKDARSVEELYLAGLRLEQFHSPASEPYPYYEEALKRDAGDARANTAMGILLIKRGMFADAEAHLKRAVERVSRNYTSPKDGEAHYYLGVALKAQAKTAAAVDALQKAAWSYAWIGPSMYQLAEIECARGNFEDAVTMLDRALAVNAFDTRAMDLKGIALRKLHRDDEARELAAKAQAIDPLDYWSRYTAPRVPEDVPEHLELAIDYASAGLWAEASVVLTRLAAAFPEKTKVSPMVYYYLGWFAHKQGNAADASRYFRMAAAMPPDTVFPFQVEAIAALEAAIEVNPGDARAHYHLGNYLYDRQPERAVREWETARKLDGEFATVHRNLAFAYARQPADLTKAIASLETAVRKDPGDPLLFFELDQLYENAQTDPAKRLELLDRYHATVVKRDDALTRQIALRVQAGQYDRAIELMTGRVFHVWEGGARFSTHDSWVNAHLLRGRQRQAAGNLQGAIDDYRKALEFPENLQVGRPHRGGRFPEIYFHLGQAYAAQGQKDKAAEAYRESALQLVGNDEQPKPTVDSGAAQLYYQAQALAALGQKERAAAIFRELVQVGAGAQKGDGAVDYFAKFGERQSARMRSAQAHYVAGLGHFGLGQNQQAKAEFTRALELNKYHLDAQTQLAALR